MKGKALYPARQKFIDDEARAWERAVDDILASALSRHVDVGPFLYAGRGKPGRMHRPIIRTDEKRLARVAKDLRRTLVGCLPEAVQIFKQIGHPKEHKQCKCRAYCLLRVNACYAAKITGDDPHEMGLDNKDMFDDYMADRN